MVVGRFLSWVYLVLGLSGACYAQGGASLDKPRYERDVVPLLKARCIKCHGPSKQEGSLDLSTAFAILRGGESGDVIQPGSLEDSQLWERVSTQEMPPDVPLDDRELTLLRNWISQGAVGLPSREELGTVETQHWAFRSLQPVSVPNVKNEAVCRTDIDRFVQALLEVRGLGIGPEADRSTLIRRVSFDVTGLPPTVKEIADFLSDASEDAYERMLEGYLASPRYGERWGKQWLDVAGYADSNGYFDSDTDRPLAYRYRDYVIHAINADKPFDDFIREQLAGDELAGLDAELNPSPRVIELLEATHFLRNAQDGTADSDGNPDEIRGDRQAVLDATVEIFGSALFGLTLQCTKCHDHKFEPVTQRDYYGLQAILAPAFDVTNWVPPPQRFVIAATAQENAAFEAALKQGKVTEQDRPGKIAAVRNLSTTPPDVFILKRGDFNAPGEKVLPSGLAVLADDDGDFSQPGLNSDCQDLGYRLAFARWLTRPAGRPAALLARVQVNRLWQRYFGTGLAATTANLGISGSAPTHPELLEWLADQLINSGWSSRAVHRLILKSAAYRQSSALNEEAHQIDPDNQWLWRMPLRRLEAEEIYDSMLSVSGELDLHMGGPATKTIRVDVGEVSVAELLPGGKRRAIYLQQRRTQIPTILRVFDAPSLVTNCVQRLPSTIPLQSLTQLNSEFVLTRAANMAKRLALEAGLESDQRIIRAFLLTLAREPDNEELQASLRFIRQQTRQYVEESSVPQRRAWADFCHSLMASNAFLYLE